MGCVLPPDARRGRAPRSAAIGGGDRRPCCWGGRGGVGGARATPRGRRVPGSGWRLSVRLPGLVSIAAAARPRREAEAAGRAGPGGRERAGRGGRDAAGGAAVGARAGRGAAAAALHQAGGLDGGLPAGRLPLLPGLGAALPLRRHHRHALPRAQLPAVAERRHRGRHAGALRVAPVHRPADDAAAPGGRRLLAPLPGLPQPAPALPAPLPRRPGPGPGGEPGAAPAHLRLLRREPRLPPVRLRTLHPLGPRTHVPDLPALGYDQEVRRHSRGAQVLQVEMVAFPFQPGRLPGVRLLLLPSHLVLRGRSVHGLRLPGVPGGPVQHGLPHDRLVGLWQQGAGHLLPAGGEALLAQDWTAGWRGKASRHGAPGAAVALERGGSAVAPLPLSAEGQKETPPPQKGLFPPTCLVPIRGGQQSLQPLA